MSKQRGHIGGFVAVNNGNIENCYSVVRLKVNKRLSGGFAAENTGTIKSSYYFGKLNHLTGGFTGNNNSNSEKETYFFHKGKDESRKLKKLSDSDKGQRVDELKNNDNISSIGFNTDDIWEYRGGEIPIGFITEKWIYKVPKQEKEPLIIRNADELKKWAAKVNDGDKEAACEYIRLENDIDLGGKEWTPIGNSRINPFAGIFDGNGHLVKNFRLKNKKIANKGFFAFFKGEVYNLSVDCVIGSGNCVGGLVAQNDNGIIGCCSAVVSINGRDGSVGGLVGKNTGTIFQSYSAGKIVVFIIPVWWVIPLAVLATGIMVIPKFSNEQDNFLPTFAPVPYDEDSVPIPDDDNIPNEDGNFVSFQFKQEIDINLNTGLCQFEFKNPGNSNHNIVVQLQFTDAQATRIMGGTGRTQEDQDKLEQKQGYDPETNRTVIAQSGAVRPGYQLDNLKLLDLQDGVSLPEGNYNAVVYLVFYDIGTNNRAMLESQLPVEIAVHK